MTVRLDGRGVALAHRPSDETGPRERSPVRWCAWTTRCGAGRAVGRGGAARGARGRGAARGARGGGARVGGGRGTGARRGARWRRTRSGRCTGTWRRTRPRRCGDGRGAGTWARCGDRARRGDLAPNEALARADGRGAGPGAVRGPGAARGPAPNEDRPAQARGLRPTLPISCRPSALRARRPVPTVVSMSDERAAPADPPAGTRRAIERWFIAEGVPHFILDYSASHFVLTRAAPLLVLYLVATTVLAMRVSGTIASNLLALGVSVAVVLGGWALLNVARGRPWRSLPRRVGVPEVLAFLLLPADPADRARAPGERRGHRGRGERPVPRRGLRRHELRAGRHHALGVPAAGIPARQPWPAADPRASAADGLHRVRVRPVGHVAHGVRDGRRRACSWSSRCSSR